MRLTSRTFENGGKIPSRYTCDDKNINPPLEISGVPEGTKSLVLIVDDPDVPEFVRLDKMWVHWIVIDMPPNLKEIKENHQPDGVPGKNTWGDLDYQGPCPPDREHRYFFKIYALSQKLNLAPGAAKPTVEKAMAGHVLAKAELMGKYEKKKKQATCC